MSTRFWILLIVTCSFLNFSCTRIDLYERTRTIPGHAWDNKYQPSFTFQIKDTASPYRLFFIIRHSDRYSFNNIYINLYARQPGQDTAQKVRYDLVLGTDEAGWLASGMDDIYEHRISLTPEDQLFYFRKPGEYHFSIEQIMRENPLRHVFDVGLRIEKKQ